MGETPVKNVVLICTDQWRGDCVGTDSPAWTPFLNGCMQSGAQASNAYSAAPTCVPARMSLLTGTKSSTHGRLGYIDGIDFDTELTLAGAFSSQGYQTQAIGKMHVSPARARAGFDNVILHDGYLHHARAGRPDVRFTDDYWTWLTDQSEMGGHSADDYCDGAHCNAVNARPWDKSERIHPTNWVTDQGIDWLYRRDPTQPFFLMLSYHRPHAPLNPPRWAWEVYDDTDFADAPRGNWEEELLGPLRNNASIQAHVADYPRWVRQRAIQGYYGNITHVDAQIERFIEALHDFGHADNTLVCFTSDHGDMMGDHGMWRKGYPYRGSTHVPLVFFGAGVAAGARIEKPVELIDIMPTLIDAAGLEIPSGLEGVSLWPDISSQETQKSETAVNKRPYLHGEHVIFGQSLQWIWAQNYTYIWWSQSGREQLFSDLDDREQCVDILSPSYTQELTEQAKTALSYARACLVNELRSRPEGFVVDGELCPGRPVALVLPGDRREAVWL